MFVRFNHYIVKSWILFYHWHHDIYDTNERTKKNPYCTMVHDFYEKRKKIEGIVVVVVFRFVPTNVCNLFLFYIVSQCTKKWSTRNWFTSVQELIRRCNVIYRKPTQRRRIGWYNYNNNSKRLERREGQEEEEGGGGGNRGGDYYHRCTSLSHHTYDYINALINRTRNFDSTKKNMNLRKPSATTTWIIIFGRRRHIDRRYLTPVRK
jgi:hypothetical protein